MVLAMVSGMSCGELESGAQLGSCYAEPLVSHRKYRSERFSCRFYGDLDEYLVIFRLLHRCSLRCCGLERILVSVARGAAGKKQQK